MRQVVRIINFLFKVTLVTLILATVSLFFAPLLLSALAFILPNGAQLVQSLPEGIFRSLGMSFILWAIIIFVLGLIVRFFLRRAAKFKAGAELPVLCNELSLEQCNNLCKPVPSAFFNPFIWALMNKLYGFMWLSLVPGINIIVGLYLGLWGPQKVWQRGGFSNFQALEIRLNKINIVSWLTFLLFLGLMVALGVFCYGIIILLVFSRIH